MASLVNRFPESSTGGNDCRPEPLSEDARIPTDGLWTLQLVLDEGAWEEIITVSAEDADVLQELLAGNKTVFYDIRRRLFMFGVKKPGH
jgi:hypothetical protein